jgi:hypothetical protein
VLTAAALMAALLVVLQGPAMAQSFDFDNDNNDIFDDNGFDFDNNRDNDIFDNNRFFGFDNDFDNDIFDDDGFFGSGGFEQETDETGDVSLSTEVVQTGNNSNQCVAPLQFGNTGNSQNAQGFSSFGSSSNDGFFNRNNDGFFNRNNDDFFNRNNDDFFRFNNGFGTNVDDVDFEGSSFEFAPEQNVNCNQAVQQSAASSS